MSSLQEIKTAIAKLPARERALLAAELYAAEPDPDAEELEASIKRGLDDIRAGRIQELGEVTKKLSEWTSKS